MKHSINSTLLVALLCTIGSLGASAQTNHSINSGSLVIDGDGDYIVTGSTTSNTIKVNSGTANITLNGVSIDLSSNGCAFEIVSGATVNLTLTGDNVLKSRGARAGLQVTTNATLEITAGSTGTLTATAGSGAGAGIGDSRGAGTGTIIIRGGTVTANGAAHAAGIGGSSGLDGHSSGGTITISGGTITANGGENGAGIGGGDGADGGTINISGGTITANGAGIGAGIGGGKGGNSSGGSGGSGGDITISGGTVTATGGSNSSGVGVGGAGIGGGGAADAGIGAGTITISGGTITANGSAYAAAIGGGSGNGSSYDNKAVGTVIITGGSVYVNNTDGPQPTSDGAGAKVFFNTLTVGDPAVAGGTPITAGSIGGVPCADTPNAATGVYGIHDVKTDDAGIVYFWLPKTDADQPVMLQTATAKYKKTYTRVADNGNSQVLTAANDLIISGDHAADPDYVVRNDDVLTLKKAGAYTITMRTPGLTTTTETIKVEADGGNTYDITLDGVGINVSGTTDACAFNIASGAVVNLTLAGDNVLKSGNNAAGLNVPSGATLTITAGSAGTLTANGGSYGAGIGNGFNNSGGTITISGGTITATGGTNGAGIGAGNIAISGGTITANSANGAGIGSGFYSAGGNITISGGVIAATSAYGAGIGGSFDRSAGNITISGGTITATSTNAAAIGGGDTEETTGVVVITGGSIKVNNTAGPQPTNGAGVNVYLNTLTVGNPAEKNASITGGKIGNAACADTPHAATGVYGIHDVKTDADGKVYFWLTKTDADQLVRLRTATTRYENSYTRGENNNTQSTLNAYYDLMISGDHAANPDYVVRNGDVLTLQKGGTYTITMYPGLTTTTTESVMILASDDDEYNITLDGVNIDVSGTPNRSAFIIRDGNSVHLTLAGSNELKSGENAAGLQVTIDAMLEITKGSTGSLTLTGGNNAAGIGGGREFSGSAGKITISGGTVIANGGGGGSGIGGGPKNGDYPSSTEKITITGGMVTATGGSSASAIGGGKDNLTGVAGGVVISGGSVKVNNTLGPQPTNGAGANVYLNTLTVGDPAEKNAPITAGKIGNAACNDTPDAAAGVYGIHDVKTNGDGIVYFWLPKTDADQPVRLQTATAKYENSYTREENNNTRKTLYAYHDLMISGDHAADPDYVVRNGNVLTLKKGGTYTITMHTPGLTTTTETIKVEADGGNTYDITLDGVGIDVSSISSACAFDMSDAKVNLTLTGDNVLKSGENAAGLYVPTGATLEITAGSAGNLTATSSNYAAGIGGGNSRHVDSNGGTITINGGTVTANGGGYGAGIGGGGGTVDDTGKNGTVNIYGGTVTAIGGYAAAGIGGGGEGSGGIINIFGGTVIATGGTGGTGIGGGGNANDAGSLPDGGTTIISGGTVTATGGEYAAGIGGGYICDGGTTIISGGTVTATGGDYAAGIGGGYKSNGGTITISGGTITATSTSTSANTAAIGGGYTKETSGTVTITGGSVKVNNTLGPQPTNGVANVYLNTLTVGDPAEKNAPITAGKIGNAACNDTPDAAAGVYGIHDVKTNGDGKVFFWLPVSTGDQTVRLTAGANSYQKEYEQTSTAANNTHTLLSVYDLLIFGDNTGDAYVTRTLDGSNTALNIKKAGTYSITMRAPGTTTTSEYIRVTAASGECNITLDSVSINADGMGFTSAFHIASGATVNLTLAGNSVLKGGSSRAALQVPGGATLEITDRSTGTLTATSRSTVPSKSAGIGGGASQSDGDLTTGTITIRGGTVTATGNGNGAGIGGSSSSSGVITISGGTITAKGGTGTDAGAGIGGGAGGDGGIITITGGTITANGGAYGAGIGGGNGGDGGTINISGGTITATGGGSSGNTSSGGAGIGGGADGAGGTINISGGTITATGGSSGTGGTGGGGIGGGKSGNGGTITISGGTITANGANGAAIGGGKGSEATGTVIITGGSINMGDHDGPQPTSAGDDVYLNTLTVGIPAVQNMSITAANIGGVTNYGINDVKTDANGKVYFWLPTSDNKFVTLTADSKVYRKKYPRTAANTNAATLLLHVLSLNVSETETFADALYGYAAPTSLPVTVTNTGTAQLVNLTVTVSGANTSAFTPSIASITSLSAPGGTADFTVAPPTGLIVGTYTATITVAPQETNISDISFDVTFTVNKKDIAITGGTVAPMIYDGSTTTATVTALTFDGLVGAETLAIGTDYEVTSANFANATAGANKPVSIVAALKSSPTANNYTLTNGSNDLLRGIIASYIHAQWTGASTGDWSDPANWAMSAEGEALPAGFLPNAITDVWIPGNATTFPTLTSPVACNNLYLLPGAQLGGQQHLTYTRAHVQLDLGLGDPAAQQAKNTGNLPAALQPSDPAFMPEHLKFSAGHSAGALARGRWYMLSTPLQGVVSGDYALGDYPWVFMQKFNNVTPSPDGREVGEWTHPFASFSESLKPAEGFAVWISAHEDAYGHRESGTSNSHSEASIIPGEDFGLKRTNGILQLPFYDNDTLSAARRMHTYDKGANESKFYYIWKHSGDLVTYQYDTYQRPADSYRLSGNQTYDLTGIGNSEILVGNPFVSAIDFVKFCTENGSSLTNKCYRIWNGTQFVTVKVDDANNCLIDGAGSFGSYTGDLRYIAPMQSFFVQVDGSASSLQFNLTATAATASNVTLRAATESAAESNTESNTIRISATNEYYTAGTLIARREQAADGYLPSEDVYKLFSQKTSVPEVYTVVDHYALAMNFISGHRELLIPIGLKTTCQGETTFTLTGMDRYDASQIAFLDMAAADPSDEITDITGEAAYSYTFDNRTADISEDRFFLRIRPLSGATLGDAHAATEPTDVRAFLFNGEIRVVASPTNPIRQVEVYNLQGRLLHRQTQIDADRCTIPAPAGEKTLLLRIVTDQVTTHVKLIK